MPTLGLPAITIILPIPGKIRKSSIALRDDSFGNDRFGSLTVGIAALNRRLHIDDALRATSYQPSDFSSQFSEKVQSDKGAEATKLCLFSA